MPQSIPHSDEDEEVVDGDLPHDEELAEAAASLALKSAGPPLPPAPPYKVIARAIIAKKEIYSLVTYSRLGFGAKDAFAEVEIAENCFSISVVRPDFEICARRTLADDANQIEKPVRFYLGYWQLRRLAPTKDDPYFITINVVEENDGIFLRIFDTDRSGNRVSNAEIQVTVQTAPPPTLLSMSRRDPMRLASAKHVSDCLSICRAALPDKPTRQSFIETVGDTIAGVSEAGMVVIDNGLLPFEVSIPVLAAAKLALALRHLTDFDVCHDGAVLLVANDTIEIAIKVEPSGSSKPLLKAVKAARDVSQSVEVDLERLFLNQFLTTAVYNHLSRRRGDPREGSQTRRLQPLSLSTRPGNQNSEAVLAAEVEKPLAGVAFMKAYSEYSIEMPGDAAFSEQGAIDGGTLTRFAGALLKIYGDGKLSITRCSAGDVGFFRVSMPVKNVNIYMALENSRDQRFRNN